MAQVNAGIHYYVDYQSVDTKISLCRPTFIKYARKLCENEHCCPLSWLAPALMTDQEVARSPVYKNLISAVFQALF